MGRQTVEGRGREGWGVEQEKEERRCDIGGGG
jgi:hypothetical protein